MLFSTVVEILIYLYKYIVVKSFPRCCGRSKLCINHALANKLCLNHALANKLCLNHALANK